MIGFMDKQEVPIIKGSPLVNLELKSGVRLVWIASAPKVSTGPDVLAVDDNSNTPYRTYSSSAR